MTKEELKSTAAKVAEAPSCYPGLKALIEAWQAAIGTAGEKAAAEKMLAGLKECVTPIDGLIAFAGSPNGEKILGKDAAAGIKPKAKTPASAPPARTAKSCWRTKKNCSADFTLYKARTE